ncbi:MAG: thiamine-phosphate kinase [Actinomycetales bacterium]|nr:thiamine-phosphate kinase [Actinomycetales bacterium]
MVPLYGGGVDGVLRVRDLDEEALLAEFVPLLPQGDAEVPVGDDAAVVPVSDGRFVVTTDVLVEDHHFRREWSSGADIGWRAVMQNAADVGAMGAVPVALVVGAVLPGDLEVEWVRALARGMAEACGAITLETGAACGVVGGDLSAGDTVVLAVTAHGDLQHRQPVLRSGARVGDVVAHAGTLGLSAAGLAALRAGREGHDDVVRVYRRPVPPLAAAVAAARQGAHALMDVSDGLLLDGGRMARASGVTLDLSLAGLLDPRVRAVAQAAGVDPLPWVAGGGEDHGFLATFAPGTLPAGFRPVGRVLPRGGQPVLVDGATPTLRTGWDHFAGG